MTPFCALFAAESGEIETPLSRDKLDTLLWFLVKEAGGSVVVPGLLLSMYGHKQVAVEAGLTDPLGVFPRYRMFIPEADMEVSGLKQIPGEPYWKIFEEIPAEYKVEGADMLECVLRFIRDVKSAVGETTGRDFG